MKTGWKTTEFWVSVVVSAVGLIASTGIVTPDQASALTEAMIQIGGLFSSVAASFGYAISRGNAKKGDS